MTEYDLIIEKLLNKQVESRSSVLFATHYIPLNKNTHTVMNRDTVSKRISSNVVSALKKHPELVGKSRLYQKIKHAIKNKLQKINKIEDGAMVFLRLSNLNSLEKKLDHPLPPDDLTLVFTSRKLKKESYIGRVYDLDQMLWVNNVRTNSLVISLDQQVASINILDGENLIQRSQLLNQHWSRLSPGDDEYLEMHRPSKGNLAVYSSGSDKVAKTRKHANQLFLKDVLDNISELSHSDGPFEFVVVFYSQAFSDLIQILTNDHVLNNSLKLLAVAKNIKNQSSKIKQEAIKKIRQFQKKTKKDKFEKAMEKHSLFISGWHKISKALRLKKVETLFVKPTSKKAGYVDKNKLVYLKPRENAFKVKNIAPWIVNSVLNGGGETVVMNNLSMNDKGPVAALLRY